MVVIALVTVACSAPAAQPTTAPAPAPTSAPAAAPKPTTAPAAAPTTAPVAVPKPTTAATAGAAPTAAPAAAAKPSGPADKVKLQIKWVPQAQFAGYFVALEKGFYKDENMDVTLVPGGPDIVTEKQLVNRQSDIGVNWVASLLAVRYKGLTVIDAAQVYQ